MKLFPRLTVGGAQQETPGLRRTGNLEALPITYPNLQHRSPGVLQDHNIEGAVLECSVGKDQLTKRSVALDRDGGDHEL
jgi:hypothetical protein